MHVPAQARRHSDPFPAKLLTPRDPLFLRSIASGPLWMKFRQSGESSFLLSALLCSFGRALIQKGRIGGHHRAVSRNGLVLFMSREPIAAMEGVRAKIRLSVWHRAFLPGEPAAPWGILLHVTQEPSQRADAARDLLQAEITRESLATATLSIELGGERILNFSS